MRFPPAQGNASVSQPSFGPFGGGFSGGQGLPSGVSNDVDAQLFIDAMTSAPDTDRQVIINQFFLDIKGIGDHGADDIFAQMDFAYLFAAHDEQASLLDVKRLFDATAVNAPVFEVDRGFTGNASNHAVDSTYIPSSDGVNFTQDDCSMGAYSRTNRSGSEVMMGASTDASNNLTKFNPRSGADAVNYSVNQAGSENTGAVTNSEGLLVIERTASNVTRAYKNGTELDVSADVSQGLPTVEVYVLALHQDTSILQEWLGQCAFAFAGAALTATEHSNLFDAVETYMDAIGAGVVA